MFTEIDTFYCRFSVGNFLDSLCLVVLSTTASIPLSWRGCMRHRSSVMYPILISLALYGISLTVPALEFLPVRHPSIPSVPPTDPIHEIWPGWEILMLGWFAIFSKQIAWYANPLHLINLGLMAGQIWRLNTTISGLTLAVGLNTLLLFWQEIPIGMTENGQLESLHIGFYCWITSLSIPLVWNSWQWWVASAHSKASLE